MSTVPALWLERARESADAVACFREDGASYRPLRFPELLASVRQAAASLSAHGIGPAHRVGIAHVNAVEWLVAELAVHWVGAASVGLELDGSPGHLAQQLAAVGAQALVVDHAQRLQAFPVATLSALSRVFATNLRRPGGGLCPLFDRTLAPCSAGPRARAGALATVVFSSGTTGEPRAIGYSHQQMLLAARAIASAMRAEDGALRTACWLPLANPFQRIANLVAVRCRSPIYLVADPREVMAKVRAIEPNLLIGVPRFFEEAHEALANRLGCADDALRGRLARWAISMHRADPIRRALARRLVLDRVGTVFGSRLRYVVSGSAALRRETHEFLAALGVPVLEAYGVSEVLVPIAMNRPNAARTGSVGRLLPENRVTIDGASQIHVAGDGLGARLAGDRLLTVDRHATGDLGRLDDDGYLHLFGRILDSFKLATGRTIAPTRAESALTTIAGVEHAVLAGEGRKATVALLQIDGARFERLVARHGGRAAATRALLAIVAAKLEDYPRHYLPSEVRILTEPFSVEAGEITSNLKLRRAAVIARYLPPERAGRIAA